MKRFFYLFGMAVLSCIISNSVSAQTIREKKPVQLQAIVSNLGFGGSLGYHLSNAWMIGADFSGVKISIKNSHSDYGDYDTVNHSLMTLPLYIRYYPNFKWCETVLGALYAQAGIAWRNWIFETMTKNMAQDGVNAKVEFSPVAGAAGLGFDWILKSGISFGLGMNFFVGATPTITMSGGPAASTSDIEKIRSDVEKHHYMSVVTPGFLAFMGYTF